MVNIRKFVESYLLEDEKGIRYEIKIWGHNPKSHSNREFEGWLEYSDGVLSIDFYVNQAKQLMSTVTKLLKRVFKIDNIDIREHVWYEEYSQDKYYKNIEYTAKGKFTLNITEEEFNAQVSLLKDSLKNLNKVGLLDIGGVRFEGGPNEVSESKVEYKYPEGLYMTKDNSREYGVNPKLIPSEGTGLSLWEYDPSGKKKYVTYQTDYGKLIKIHADYLHPKKVVMPESREGIEQYPFIVKLAKYLNMDPYKVGDHFANQKDPQVSKAVLAKFGVSWAGDLNDENLNKFDSNQEELDQFLADI